MEASTITVHWHDDNSPIYSVDFQPLANKHTAKRDDSHFGKSPRLATAGGDNNIRLWNISYDTSPVSINYLCTLTKHTQAVNVVKFNREGDCLASAGDDGSLILWKKSDTIVKEFGAEEDDECKESWIAKTILRSSNSEIYDISWSPDSKYIATGSMDNIIRIYDMKGQIYQLTDHSHYVQGVAWDPQNKYLATQSADRSVNVYELEDGKEPKLVGRSSKATFPVSTSGLPSNSVPEASAAQPVETVTAAPQPAVVVAENGGSTATSASTNGAASAPAPSKTRTALIYHSETLQSFFRRLKFSPDGNLLLAPSGIFKAEQPTTTPSAATGSAAAVPNATSTTTTSAETAANAATTEDSAGDETNSVFIYTRSGLGHSPVCQITNLKKPAIAVSFSPIIYELSRSKAAADSLSPFKLSHKMVFAIATQDSVVIYDTEKLTPLGYASNLHYSSITDLAWDEDGESLIISSTDGFCSNIRFKENAFGRRKVNAETEAKEQKEEVKNEVKKESVSVPVASEVAKAEELTSQVQEGSEIKQIIEEVATVTTTLPPVAVSSAPVDIIERVQEFKVKSIVPEKEEVSTSVAEPSKPSNSPQKLQTIDQLVSAAAMNAIKSKQKASFGNAKDVTISNSTEESPVSTDGATAAPPQQKKRRIQPILIE